MQNFFEEYVSGLVNPILNTGSAKSSPVVHKISYEI